MFINWGLESMKWQYLVSHIQKLSFTRTFSAVMAGVAVSSFTPNRVGEFAGRMLFLENKLDPRVVALTIIGSMSQLMITLIIGLPGLLIFLNRDYHGISILWEWIKIILYALPFIYIVVFYNLPVIFRWLKRRFATNKTIKHITNGASFLNRRGLGFISLLSLIRYMIFGIQFMLVLLFFNVDISWVEGLIYIPVIFFVQSVIPSFIIVEVGVRIAIAVAVLNFTNSPQNNIIASSSLLWVINIMIPALLGVFALFSTKLSNNE